MGKKRGKITRLFLPAARFRGRHARTLLGFSGLSSRVIRPGDIAHTLQPFGRAGETNDVRMVTPSHPEAILVVRLGTETAVVGAVVPGSGFSFPTPRAVFVILSRSLNPEYSVVLGTAIIDTV